MVKRILKINIENNTINIEGRCNAIEIMATIGALVSELKKITGVPKRILLKDILEMSEKVEKEIKRY